MEEGEAAKGKRERLLLSETDSWPSQHQVTPVSFLPALTRLGSLLSLRVPSSHNRPRLIGQSSTIVKFT